MRSFHPPFAAILAVCIGFGANSAAAQTKSREVELEKLIPSLLMRSDIPGMSIAVIRKGETAWTGAFGVKNSETGAAVADGTIFEAASLTKPVVAYAALKLVDRGMLDLDKPLNSYLGNRYDVGDDPRLDKITARRVLSHTSGFPNWRNRDSKTLPINFEPGEKFSYSGEGFVYLAKVIEKITEKDLDSFISESVFVPLGMNESSMDWKKEYFEQKTFNHDSLGKPRGQNEERGVNAAASLHTTARDYAKFTAALMKGDGLKAETAAMMLTPQVAVDKKKAPELSWGLGIALESGKDGVSFWHWGDNGFNRSFVIANPGTGDGVVFFANGANGLSFLSEILEAAVGGSHPSEKWLGYERFDSPARVLFKSIVDGGAAKALSDFLERRTKNPEIKVTERQMNRLGYDLLRIDRKADAVLVFRQNSDDHPESANVWDSLAEGHLATGNKGKALEYYLRSLKLDPSNKNAEQKIAELSADQ